MENFDIGDRSMNDTDIVLGLEESVESENEGEKEDESN